MECLAQIGMFNTVQLQQDLVYDYGALEYETVLMLCVY